MKRPVDLIDYERFLKLFAADRERIYVFIFFLLPNHADAEDVFQKSSLVMWRKIDQLTDEGIFFTWACAVAKFEVRNFVSRMARERLTFSSEMLDRLGEERTARPAIASSRLDALRACVAGLPISDRQLIDILYSHDAPLNEFAKQQGKALQTLYNRAAILRQRLADCVRRRLSMEAS